MPELTQQTISDSNDFLSSLRDEQIPGRLLIEINESNDYSRLPAYAHYLRRAVEDKDLGIQAIYCFDGLPTIYFKEVQSFDAEVELRAQRALWNQGVATLLVVSDPRQVRVYSAFVPVVETIQTEQEKSALRSKSSKKNPSQGLSQGLSSAQIESLERAVFAVEIDGWLRRVENGQIYREHEAKFEKESAVDRQLLRNLRSASDLLHSGDDGLQRHKAHALLSRVLFVCYLFDRGVVTKDYIREKLQIIEIDNLLALLESRDTLSDQKDTLYALFTALQEDFNGSLLNEDLQAESRLVQPSHIHILLRLLRGDELKSGQQSLFPYYNFKWIPIETISALYENFLALENSTEESASNSQNQSQTGAYYTPRHLAEMAVQSATRDWSTFLDKRCLDPACGSGIFLVILFNRMAEEWHRLNSDASNLDRALAFRQLLTERLCGVDLQATSCRITCFSLYLAFFDRLTPPDIWNLQQKLGETGLDLLPLLLQTPIHRSTVEQNESATEYQVPETQNPVIYEANFFDTNSLFGTGPLGEFDLVIGNPPWTGRNHEPDLVAESWLRSDANIFRSSVSASKRNMTFSPQGHIAIAFMWKVPLHLKQKGKACLVLPSKIFLSETDDFQSAWLRKFAVERVVQLADYSFLLFENAICPANIVTFRPTPPKSGRDVIWYDVPKFERRDPRHAVISVWPEDQQWLRVGEIIEAANDGEAALVWKKWLWGRTRDTQLLKNLRQWPTLGELAGEPNENKRWIKGQGGKPFHVKSYEKNPKSYGEPKPPKWPTGAKYLDARNPNIDLFLLNTDLIEIPEIFKQLYRSPDGRVFTPPLVIFNQKFNKFAFYEEPVAFQHALQSVTGPQTDRDNLLFLTGVLNSPISSFFLFHTSANWGVERDKVHLHEFLRLPFVLPENHSNPTKAKEIVESVAQIIMDARQESIANFIARCEIIKTAKIAINHLIYNYYDLSPDEIVLVEDTVTVSIPSSTPGSFHTPVETQRKPTESERETYTNLLCETLNSWIFNSSFRMSGHVITSAKFEMGAVILTKQLAYESSKSSYEDSEAPKKIDDILGRLKRTLQNPNQPLSYLRGFVLFERNTAFLVKPLNLRSWTRSAALHDADELIGSFLQYK